MSNPIGDYIQKLRVQFGLTQEQLSETLMVSRQAISKWERGETLPDVYMLKKLASLFGTSMEMILDAGVIQKNGYVFREVKGINVNIQIPSLNLDYDVMIDYVDAVSNSLNKKYKISTSQENQERDLAIDIQAISGFSVDVKCEKCGSMNSNVTLIPSKYDTTEERNYSGIARCKNCGTAIHYEFSQIDFTKVIPS